MLSPKTDQDYFILTVCGGAHNFGDFAHFNIYYTPPLQAYHTHTLDTVDGIEEFPKKDPAKCEEDDELRL